MVHVHARQVAPVAWVECISHMGQSHWTRASDMGHMNKGSHGQVRWVTFAGHMGDMHQ